MFGNLARKDLLFLVRLSLDLLVISVSSLEEIKLHTGVTEVAREKEHVSGSNHPSESHEEARVEEKGRCHSARDVLSRFVRVRHGSSNKGPVGSGSPEVYCLWSDWRVHEFKKGVHI